MTEILRPGLPAPPPQWRGLIRLYGTLSLGALNQALVSLANFLFSLYLVRVLTIADFGLFALALAASQLFVGFGNALFVTQLVVSAHHRSQEERPVYALRMYIALSIFSVLSGAFVLVSACVAGAYGARIMDDIAYAVLVVIASITFLHREFFVRYAYLQQREVSVFWTNLGYATSLGILSIFAHAVDHVFTIYTALCLYAAAQLASGLTGCALSDIRFRAGRWRPRKRELLAAWSGGRWAAATSFVYFLRVRAAIFITGAYLGPAGVGLLSLAQLFVAPAVMLTPALSQILLPRAAQIWSQEPSKSRKFALLIGATLLGIALIYSTSVLAAFDVLATYLPNGNPHDLFYIVLVCCATTCVLAIKNGLEIDFQAASKFRTLTFATFLSAPFGIVAVGILTSTHEVVGAAAGALLGELALTLLLLLWWWRDWADERKGVRAFS